ncbi:Oidioi.mRNA.OKI2018_I69.PAR.g12962.t2.cds [Oikopleura dioica]|uniref:Endoglucanase n=1 Tax=Oikopleura dioica TaxID=34765 RepID=A0ABN7S2J1_OIKDI|nr:Oidioi.mRNA.OKI2018_I69.PAR.g12962.t2.cds [Oikopleura dioica]
MKLLPILLGSSGIFAQNETTQAALESTTVEKPCNSENIGSGLEIKLENETEVEEIQLQMEDFTLKAAKNYIGLTASVNGKTCGKKLSTQVLRRLAKENAPKIVFNCKKAVKGDVVKIFAKAASTEDSARSNCKKLKNVDNQSGLIIRAQWFDKGAHQFNAFGWMPVSGRVSNWKIIVEFNTAISDDGKTWELLPMSYNKVLDSKFNFDFLAKAESGGVKATTWWCHDGINGGSSATSSPAKAQPTKAPPQKHVQTKPAPKPSIINRPTSEKTTTSPSTKPANPPKTVSSDVDFGKISYNKASKDHCSRAGGNLKSQSATKPTFKKASKEEVAKTKYDLNEVIAKSILFYEAQRSGELPEDNRVKWRGDSGLNDGCDIGRDLTGGWYDAGDYVKFGLPMAWSTTTLTWGIIEYGDAYKAAGEYENALAQVKWTLDYFVKCHIAKDQFVAQIGNAKKDHEYWGRAEEMRMNRPTYIISPKNPGSDVVGESAAALAAGSLLFRESNPKLADEYLAHARELYALAKNYQKDYNSAIPMITEFYKSWGYKDEIAWASAWIYRASGDSKWKAIAERDYNNFGIQYSGVESTWDSKKPGTMAVMLQATKNPKYATHLAKYVDSALRQRKTPKGMIYVQKWAPLRHASNIAFMALQAAMAEPKLPKASQYFQFAQKQLNYALGSTGRSYVVGFGKSPPKEPHHRGSSCPAKPKTCDWAQSGRGPAPWVLFGALVGGPNEQDRYTDSRKDYIANEVATDYNAAFQGLAAGVKCKLLGGDCTVRNYARPSIDLPLPPAKSSHGSSSSSAPLPTKATASKDTSAQEFKNGDFENGHHGWICNGCKGSRVAFPWAAQSGKAGYKVESRLGAWAGPAQDFVFGKDLLPGNDYIAEVYIRPQGNDQKAEKFIMTANIEFKSGKPVWKPIASVQARPKQWTRLSGTISFDYKVQDVKNIRIYIEGPPPSRSFVIDSASLKSVHAGKAPAKTTARPAQKTTPKPMKTTTKPKTKPTATTARNWSNNSPLWQNASGGKLHKGDITVYAEKPDGGNCGYPKFSDETTKYFVALPKPMWEKGANCGRCVEIDCTAGNVGTNCDAGKTTVAMVVDSCPECHEGDLDLSNAAWDKVSGNAGHSRFKANWKFIECPDRFMMKDTFEFHIKEGSSKWWLAVMPLNHKHKMKSIEIKKGDGAWKSMEFGTIDSFYWKGAPQVDSFELRFTLVTGQSITHKVSEVVASSTIDTKKKF